MRFPSSPTERSPRSDQVLRWLVAKISLTVFVLLIPAFLPREVEAQRRRAPQSRRPAIDYSKFSHVTAKHQQACNTCHKVPTRNWQTASQFPDVADYPDHAACVSCHRSQFFRGASPVICSVCHTRIGPKADARFEFAKTNASTQFTTEFPHDKHQDVIARVYRRPSNVFRRVSFHSSPFADDQIAAYNNCTICHAPQSSPPQRSWTDGYVPDGLTFKGVPTSHASCFNCHWKSQAPVSTNCNGCHKLMTSASVRPEFPTRISLKFKHDGGGERKNHIAECTTCHINITKSATLRGLKPDVPITSCTECHNKDGLRLDVSGELVQVDKNKDFVCVYCHTSNVGRRDPPPSHYLIAGREPLSRKTIK